MGVNLQYKQSGGAIDGSKAVISLFLAFFADLWQVKDINMQESRFILTKLLSSLFVFAGWAVSLSNDR
jgi:hypothetical protein